MIISGSTRWNGCWETWAARYSSSTRCSVSTCPLSLWSSSPLIILSVSTHFHSLRSKLTFLSQSRFYSLWFVQSLLPWFSLSGALQSYYRLSLMSACTLAWKLIFSCLHYCPAVKYPLKAMARGKSLRLVGCCWVTSAIFSIPQVQIWANFVRSCNENSIYGMCCVARNFRPLFSTWRKARFKSPFSNA